MAGLRLYTQVVLVSAMLMVSALMLAQPADAAAVGAAHAKALPPSVVDEDALIDIDLSGAVDGLSGLTHHLLGTGIVGVNTRNGKAPAGRSPHSSINKRHS
ncbi:uncharacterized protein LOC126278607 [Schistocerca gregaria]|uniref:uncharacterized protein LOC126278607 n=1 Tax=Schistocerca gregaria TaxID=7010 RepID=UPI00211F2A7C|nr:uncharacterized protein LOC126278607 [Schistocerca gregaria]